MTINELVLTPATPFPANPTFWLDLLSPDRTTFATIQTLTQALKDTHYTKPGNYISSDGVRDIILDEDQLTPENVKKALTYLSKETGVNYTLKVN